MSPTALKSPKDQAAELEAKLKNTQKAAQEQEKALQERIALLEGKELNEDDKRVLKYLCGQDQGARYHTLETEMNWNFRRLKHTLDKLKNHGFTAIRGGGELLNYIEASDAGMAFAVREGLV